MSPEEFEALMPAHVESRSFSVDDLTDKSDRTLLYGYTCMGKTWHVYLKGGEITCCVCGTDHVFSTWYAGPFIKDARDLIPDDRLYSSACDAETCRIFLARGIDLRFLLPDDRPAAQFYGRLAD